MVAKSSLEDIEPEFIGQFAGVISGTSGNYDWDKYNPPARPDVNPERAIRILETLNLEDLYALGDVYNENDADSSDFMFSLRDAMVLMVQRIIERYPTSWKLQAPSSFPEREIYDSVLGIMEDEQIMELNVTLGGYSGSKMEVERVAIKLFESLEGILIEKAGHPISIPGVGKSRIR